VQKKACPHFSSPDADVGSVTYAKNSDGSPSYSEITGANGFDTITSATTMSRLVDPAYYRLGMKLVF